VSSAEVSAYSSMISFRLFWPPPRALCDAYILADLSGSFSYTVTTILPFDANGTRDGTKGESANSLDG
jgi:hypothetical protein